MSGPPDQPQHAVPTVVAGCAAAVDQVADASLWSLGDAELLTLLDDAYALISKVHALALSAVAEAATRDLAERFGAPSTAALLRHRLHLSPACARRDVVLAGALTGVHPVLAGALRGSPSAAAGEAPAPIRVEQAAAIADVLADPPPAVSATAIGTTEDGTRLSPNEVARHACEADPILALLTHGIPTWLSRRDRTARGILRRALVLRDGGCAFPGCDRPASWCHAHHIIPWQAGGPTVSDNLVLLCGHHHRLIHTGEWSVAMADDGHPDFHPPPWIDPDRTPLRNTTRNLLRT